MFEPGELLDQPTEATCYPEDDVRLNAGLCHNAYPEPGDALDPEPYVKGSYERLQPYDPPPRRSRRGRVVGDRALQSANRTKWLV